MGRAQQFVFSQPLQVILGQAQVGEPLPKRKWTQPPQLIACVQGAPRRVPPCPHMDVLLAQWQVPPPSARLRRWLSPQPASSFSFPAVFLFPQSFGFSLLACSNYHWQLSFLRAEQVLLEQLDEDGGCRRKCLQAMRQMKEDVWCPGKRPVITSYHLQVSVPPRPRGPGRLGLGGSLCGLCRVTRATHNGGVCDE